MEQETHCPYCAEPVTLLLDPGAGGNHTYVEDCPVCCRPWQVRVWRDMDGTFRAQLAHQDE